MQPNLHFFGIQGSGKDTQASRLATILGLYHLSSGSIIRSRMELQDELGITLSKLVHTGHLVPDELYLPLVLQELAHQVQGKGIVAAGVIRTTNQLSWFEQRWAHYNLSLPLAIHLDISDELARERILIRGRSDDTDEAIAERFQQYHVETHSVLAAFEADGRLVRIDGAQSVEEVTIQLLSLLPEYHPNLHAAY
jgi:adenylate kinase